MTPLTPLSLISGQRGIRRLLNIDTDGVFVHQIPTQHARHTDQGSAEQRNEQSPGHDLSCGIGKTQGPVQRGQRQQHDRKYGVTPSSNQTPDALHHHQIQKADYSGQPPSCGTNTCQPQTGPGPKGILSNQVSHIRGDQPDQCRHRQVNQSRVDRMARYGHTTANGSQCHGAPQTLVRKVVRRAFASGRRKPSLAIGLATRISALLATNTLCILITGCTGPFSIVDPAGPSATYASWLWWGMFIAFSSIFAIVVALWLYALRKPPRDYTEQQASAVHLRWLIGGGLVLPATAITLLLVIGTPLGYRMLPLPPPEGPALQVDVTGHQWWWHVYYPNTNRTLKDEVYIPVGRPVDLHLTSADVIHSLWVPRLAGKLDAIPGRTNVLRIQAREPGKYRGQCAEFCGLHHAHMQITIQALPEEQFDHWLEGSAND